MPIVTTNEIPGYAMRFDTSEVGDRWTEIRGYGSAVLARLT